MVVGNGRSCWAKCRIFLLWVGGCVPQSPEAETLRGGGIHSWVDIYVCSNSPSSQQRLSLTLALIAGCFGSSCRYPCSYS